MENLVIIGSGPAGLSAAIYAARANLNPLVIEGTSSGGQLTLTSEVENFPGFPEGIEGIDLMAKFRQQAEKFGARFINGQVIKFKIQNSKFKSESQKSKVMLLLSNNHELETKAILIATGAEAMWLGLESEQRLRGKGVSACATCDGFFFKNKTVAVVGGGDVALDDALTLTKFAEKVYLIHRRAEFRASKIMQERVKNNSKIEIIWNAKVQEVLGEEKVEGVKIENIKSNVKCQMSNKISNLKELKIDGLFVAIGHKPATEFLKESGVKLDDKGYIITTARAVYENSKFKSTNNKSNLKFPTSLTELRGASKIQNKKPLFNMNNYDFNYQYGTNISGVFAAGDCVDSVYRQAVVAAGMGVAAELEIEKYLA